MGSTQRPRGSLSGSWGEDDYSSDGSASIHSASDLSDPGIAGDSDLGESDGEFMHEHQNLETPLPSRTTRASSKQPQDTPLKTPASRVTSRHLQTPKRSPHSPKSARSTPRSDFEEPSLIMPSISNMDASYNGSPLRNPQIRNRRMRQSSLHSQTPSLNASPRTTNRQPSTRNFSQPRQEQPKELGPWHYVNLFCENVASPLIQYLLDVISYAMIHFVKPILGVILGVFIIVLGIQAASGYLWSTVQTALSPICFIPGSSYVVPFCDNVRSETGRANFEELIGVQSHFEDILDASKDSYGLPSTMKNSELAIRDLRTLVKYSRLPSRHQLDVEFEYFIQTAKQASEDLLRFNTKIGAAMDRVISTNTWTMNVLQGLGDNEAGAGYIGRAISAMTGGFIASSPTLQQRIYDQYILHVGKNKDEISELISRAQALLLILHNLDERLDTIYAIAIHDDQTITRNQDELLSFLWTKLGGNTKTRRENEKQLALLKEVTNYRRKAITLVSETLLKLQEIANELENLRETVAAPEVLGWRDDLPLSYHIEIIDRGVERLKAAKGDYARVEGETYRKLARGGEDGGASKELPSGQSTFTVRAN